MEQKVKSLNKNEEPQKTVGHHSIYQHRFNGNLRRTGQNRSERTVGEIMAENFPNLI